MSTTQHEVDEAFLREARIGLMVLTALIALFLYVAFGKLSGWNQPEPVAFQQDGVAISNAADDPDSAEQRTASQDSPPGESQAAPRPEPPTNRPPSPISSSINRRPKSEPASVSAPRHAFSQESEAADSNPSLTPTADSFAPAQNDASTENRTATSFSGKRTLRDAKSEPRSSLPRETSTGSARSAEAPTFRRPNLTASIPSQVSRFLKGDAGKVKAASAAMPLGSAGSPAENEQPTGNLMPGASPMIDPRPVGSGLAGPRATEPKLAESQTLTPSSLPANSGAVVVEEGEGFWMVAQKVYGDGRFFDALYQFNRNAVKSFNDVPAGTELMTPPISELRSRWPYLCPREEIRTLGGETLFDLASEHLGQASRYVELMRLNYARLPKGVKQDTPLPADVTLELPRYH